MLPISACGVQNVMFLIFTCCSFPVHLMEDATRSRSCLGTEWDPNWCHMLKKCSGTIWIRKAITCNLDNYRPWTKLREGNVFTGVCLFRGGREVPCDHYPWYIGHKYLSPLLVTWHLVAITGDTGTYPPRHGIWVLPPPPASTYGWQAGGTHPTGMLCCYTKFCVDLWKITITHGLFTIRNTFTIFDEFF